MHPQGFKPFTDTLKQPGNLILLGIAALLVIDYFIGSPLMTQVTLIQLRIQKIDPDSQHMKIITMFGTFTRVDTWTMFIERVLIAVFAAIPGMSILWGLFSSITGK